MITDKEIADKRNEVLMLRLQIAEHKERRRLDEIEQLELTDVSALGEANETIHNAQIYIDTLKAELSNSKSAIVMKNGVINDRVEHLERVYNQLHGFQDDVYEKNKTIDDLGTQLTEKCAIINEITRLRVNEVETREALEADLITLAAYRNNPLSDQVADRDKRIEQLIVLNEALRIDMELAHNLSRDHIAGQDRFIKELKSRMTGARIIIDNQATSIEGLTKDLNLKIKIIGEFKDLVLRSGIEKLKCETTIDELNDMCSDACGKLERIEKIAEHPAYDCFSTALDEITKIIQEE